jgi:hypothetical protein
LWRWRWRRVLVELWRLRSEGGREWSRRLRRRSECGLRSGRRVDRLCELLWRGHVLVRDVGRESRLISGWWRSSRTFEGMERLLPLVASIELGVRVLPSI